MILSSSKQRQLIGILRKKLNIDNDIYYEMLSNYGVKSSKELKYQDAEKLLKKLKTLANQTGNWQYGNYDKYESLSNRIDRATPAQLRKIDVMWKNVSFMKTNELKEAALNNFIFKITGKKRLNFLTQNDVRKIINAIEHIKPNK